MTLKAATPQNGRNGPASGSFPGARTLKTPYPNKAEESGDAYMLALFWPFHREVNRAEESANQ